MAHVPKELHPNEYGDPVNLVFPLTPIERLRNLISR